MERQMHLDMQALGIETLYRLFTRTLTRIQSIPIATASLILSDTTLLMQASEDRRSRLKALRESADASSVVPVTEGILYVLTGFSHRTTCWI